MKIQMNQMLFNYQKILRMALLKKDHKIIEKFVFMSFSEAFLIILLSFQNAEGPQGRTCLKDGPPPPPPCRDFDVLKQELEQAAKNQDKK